MAADNTSDIYFIDTSALVTLFRDYHHDLIDSIWEKIEGLFRSGRMYSHRLVYDEITWDSKRPDLPSKKITPLQAYFKPVTFEQAQIVSNIVKRFPGFIDIKSEKEESRPWLIAAGILEQRQLSLFNPDKTVFIVTEESELDRNGVPTATKGFGLSHLNLNEFIRINNWSFKSVE